jgi:hypothetical protein
MKLEGDAERIESKQFKKYGLAIEIFGYFNFT